MDFTPRRVKTNRAEGGGGRKGGEKEIFHRSDSIRDAWGGREGARGEKRAIGALDVESPTVTMSPPKNSEFAQDAFSSTKKIQCQTLRQTLANPPLVPAAAAFTAPAPVRNGRRRRIPLSSPPYCLSQWGGVFNAAPSSPTRVPSSSRALLLSTVTIEKKKNAEH